MKRKYIIGIIVVMIFAVAFGIVSGVIWNNKTNRKQEQDQIIIEKEMKVEKENDQKRNEILARAEVLIKGYFYDEAMALLNEDKDLINSETNQKIQECKNLKNGLVKYTGTVEHIFFHSLILYPEHLFPNLKVPDAGYNAGFSYLSEIEKILPQLLERNYVLYDLREIFQKDENGVVTKKDIYLPEGKKPLVLSIDDPTYHYGIGFAHRLVLDDDGNIKTEVITPKRETIYTDNGDVELVVENFVAKHPEFSYRGARGTIAATGYMGIFGYDLKTDESVEDAKKVVQALKDRGWTFASHSYTHNRKGFYGPESKTSNIKYDVEKWKRIMEPVVGKTNIFIAPFGYRVSKDSMKIVTDNDFYIYCTVALYPKLEENGAYGLMSRTEIGGYSFKMYTAQLNERFFNVDEVVDSYRPPLS